MELHKGRKRKNSKCVGMSFNAIGSNFKLRHAHCLHDHVIGHVVCRHSFIFEPVRKRDLIIILLTAYRTGLLTSLLYFTLLYFTLLYFTLLYFSLLHSPSPFYWDKIINLSPNSLPSFFGQKNSELEKFIPSRIFILYSCRWSLNNVH